MMLLVTPLWVTPLSVTEYGPVPPLTDTVTLPSLLPLQLAGVVISEATIAVGWPTNTPAAEPEQECASVMVAG